MRICVCVVVSEKKRFARKLMETHTLNDEVMND